MAKRRQAELIRSVSSRGIAAAVFSHSTAAVFVILGLVADRALQLTPMVFLIIGAVFLASAASYLEGIAMLPGTGGSVQLARRGFNELVSFVAGWAIILDYLITVAIAAWFAVHYLATIPGLDVIEDGNNILVSTGLLIAAVALLAIRGARLGARLGVAMSSVALLVQALLIVLGAVMLLDADTLTRGLGSGQVSGSDLAFALPLAMMGFSALEIVANRAEELDAPMERVSVALLRSAALAIVVVTSMAALAILAMPVGEHGAPAGQTLLGISESKGGYSTTPIVGLVVNLGLGDTVASAIRIVIALVAAGTLFLAAETSISGMSRLVWSMARYGQFPSMLSRLGHGRAVPVRAVTIFSGIAFGILALGTSAGDSAMVLAQIYAFGVGLAMFIANVAVLRIRWREPQLPRPWRAPGAIRLRGKEVPLLPLIGALSSGALWLCVLFTHPAAMVIGVIWLTIGFVGYTFYRTMRGRSLTRTYEPRTVRPADLGGALGDYDRVLLAVRPERGRLFGAGDAELAAIVGKIAARSDDSGLHVLTVHEVSLTRDLDAPLGDVEIDTDQRLSRLRETATKVGLVPTFEVVRGRSAGRRICQAADQHNSQVVVLGMARRRRVANRPFGRTVEFVLRHAPCDVVVVAFPDEALSAPDGRRTRVAAASLSTGALRDRLDER